MGFIFTMASPVVDLPQPLSPTSPTVSPRLTLKLMPSTALTAPTFCGIGKPLKMGKCTRRSRTSSMVSAPWPLLWPLP
jgi:hypothetical protein